MYSTKGTVSIPSSLPNYSLDKTLQSGQTFRWIESTENTDGEWYLPTKVDSNLVIYFVEQYEDEIQFSAVTNSKLHEDILSEYLEYRLGFDFNYCEAIESLSRSDPELFESASVKGLSLIQDPPYETLISFISSPQASLSRIRNMQRNIEKEYGKSLTYNGSEFHFFPSVEVLAMATEEELRELGLGYRASYILRTSIQIQEQSPSIPVRTTNMPTGELRKRLQEFYGVGPKVADCILLYGYRRTNVIPVDTRIKSMVSNWYGHPAESPEEAKKILETKWESKYQGYYQLLLYEYADTVLSDT